jgi:hypothetical protein
MSRPQARWPQSNRGLQERVRTDHAAGNNRARTQYCSFKLQIRPQDLLVTMAADVIAWLFAKVHLVAQRTRRA